jgi:uncharacterized protein (TIGR00369 family)
MEYQAQGEPASPDVQARIRASFDRQGLMRHLGAHLTHIGPGRVHITLASRPEVTQHHGYFHTGATSAIADTAGGYAASTLYADGREVLSVEYKINLLAPAVGDHLDFAVDDLDEAGTRVPKYGAAKPEFQPGGDRWRVFTDPAGHPFCLATS